MNKSAKCIEQQHDAEAKNIDSLREDEDLKKEFPVKIQDQTFTTQNMLIYLLAHFNYHLGQVNYLRRML